MKLAISETFHSIQGEGTWVGTPMFFIRVAGCNVGKLRVSPMPDNRPKLHSGLPAWQCHTYDDRPFWCDTDFAKYNEMEVLDLVEEALEPHICLTGGEPLMPAHRDAITMLIREAVEKGRMVHIETSGTWLPPDRLIVGGDMLWITCSPKAGYLKEVIAKSNELKLLVDDKFNPDKLPVEFVRHPNVFIQPINGIGDIDSSNMRRCLAILGLYPNWRLSTQMHKLIGVR